MTEYRKLVIILHESSTNASEVAARLQAFATRRRIDATTLGAGENLPGDTDLVVSIGGDGTLLRAVSLAHPVGVPAIGVNLGTVGYLADVSPNEIEEMLDALASGKVRKFNRMTLTAKMPDGTRFDAINDIVLEKVISQRLVQLAVAINDTPFVTFRADGLIVATPLGSTAYSLSAGGPILDPKLAALILTPVAPHRLLSRSIVLDPDAIVKFTVGRDRPVRVNLDGREAGVIGSGECVTVTRGNRPAHFLSVSADIPFPQRVQHQFGLEHD